ncbi:MAG TPA: hypothetical protein EYP22_06235, partial [Methanosarcinales archaeon]|nr:hypothetical protein [Methanosarcinales archaeon]
MKNLKKTSILLTTLIVLSVLVATLSPSIATNYPILEEVFAKDDGNDAFVDSLTENVDYTILLQSRQFVPESGIDPILEKELLKRAEGFHVLIQFNNIPTDTEKKALESFGVELLDYIPNNAWYAYVPDGNTVYDIIARPNVRAIIEILPPDKIAPAIRNYGVGKWATNEDKTVNLQVIFFDDVSKDMAIQIISKYGTVVEEPNLGNVWAITVQSDAIPDLADEDSVQWIDQVPPPKTTNNDGSRAAIKVNTVQSPPYNLNGYGVVIAEWDGGWADNTHNDLKGRVTIGDTGSSVASHATHVAGTAIGDGTNSGGVYRGMATKAKLISYEWPDTISEMDSETSSAINKYGAVISQNSWGW